MRLPDLTFRPTPAWLRYQREAKARQRRAQLNAWRSVVCSRLATWWKQRPQVVFFACMVLLPALPFMLPLPPTAIASCKERVADAERRANDFGELALALTRGQRARQVSIRLAADGPDDALRQLEQLRALLVAQRGEVRP